VIEYLFRGEKGGKKFPSNPKTFAMNIKPGGKEEVGNRVRNGKGFPEGVLRYGNSSRLFKSGGG